MSGLNFSARPATWPAFSACATTRRSSSSAKSFFSPRRKTPSRSAMRIRTRLFATRLIRVPAGSITTRPFLGAAPQTPMPKGRVHKGLVCAQGGGRQDGRRFSRRGHFAAFEPRSCFRRRQLETVVVNDRANSGLCTRPVAAHHAPLPGQLHGNAGQLHGQVHRKLDGRRLSQPQPRRQNDVKAAAANRDRLPLRALFLSAAALPSNFHGKFERESNAGAQKGCRSHIHLLKSYFTANAISLQGLPCSV